MGFRFMVLAAVVLAGCDSGAADDAGMDSGGRDAGRSDAGMDAGRAPDAGRAIECEGTPPACALLDEERCSQVDGCRMSRCGGFPVECDRLATMADCAGSAGCSWSGTACTGRAAQCSTFDDEGPCRAQVGCVFSPVLACRGVATACELLARDGCEAQPGCGLPRDGGPPLRDAGVPMCDPDAGRPPGCVPPAGPPPFPGCNPDTGIECDGDWTGTNPGTGREYCEPACGAGECCVPRDGRFTCRARGADGACPAADIFVDATRIAGRYVIDEQFFDASDCAIAEGCVSGMGMRRLLRFATYTPNTGGADLYLGAVPPRGTSTDVFEWSGCHGHHHFVSYAEYELLGADGCCVAVTGRKQAFCLIDLGRYDPTMGSDRAVYNCGFQGIQRGWQDVYSAGLTCQWIDITGVAPGEYLLRIRLNAEHVLLEESYDNNEVLIPVTIP